MYTVIKLLQKTRMRTQRKQISPVSLCSAADGYDSVLLGSYGGGAICRVLLAAWMVAFDNLY